MISYSIVAVACFASFNIGAIFLAALLYAVRKDRKDVPDVWHKAWQREADINSQIAVVVEDMSDRLDRIVALETTKCASVGRRMAAVARGAL